MYCTRKVTDGLYWVGANDHRLRLFENIHPIERGVSYNAYLLLDEQSVLFDAVDWSSCRQLMENLDHLLDGRPLDVLVVSHLEPDHGASVEEILRRWPQVKVAASAKCFQLMGQFGFCLDGHEKIAVKEGDRLSFGKHAVSFLAAPMVHWPEVLMAFDAAGGVLFTADAFGSFNALDGKLFQDEVDFPRDWLDEARRYYANIVGKFGPQVQAALKKAAAIQDQIRFLCPLHGPVWRGDLPYLLDKYQRWSTYTPEDRTVMIVYASMYGGTESAAQALAARLTEKGVKGTTVYDVSNTHVSTLISEAFRVSHIVLAGVTYNMGIFPPMADFLHDMKALNLQNRTFALLENGSWACKAGDLTERFLREELKGMTVLDRRVTMASRLGCGGGEALDALADALVESLSAEP